MRAALLVALVALTGCASQLGMGRARTIAAGTTRMAVGFEGDVIAVDGAESGQIPVPWTQASLGLKRGMTDRVELGVRAWGFSVPRVMTTFGAGADAKIGLVNPTPKTGRISLATGLSLAYHRPTFSGAPPYHVFGATLPLLVGVDLGRHELVLGPRIADYVWTGYGQNTINTFYAGSSLGMSIAVKRSLELMPEVLAMYSPVSFDGEASSSRVGVWMIQFGVGASYDL